MKKSLLVLTTLLMVTTCTLAQFKVKRYGILTNGYWVPNKQSANKMKGKNSPKEIDFSKHTQHLPSDHYPVFVRLER